MKFSVSQVERFQEATEKIQRYFAYKYGVVRKEVGVILKEKSIHILISGKLKESLRAETLHTLEIDEQNLTVK